ncbi:MAG: hypothetical protein KY475_08405 [Planctomycetes bacterium]|nr:hypothetical protein [Planctomycetota bacterium]
MIARQDHLRRDTWSVCLLAAASFVLPGAALAQFSGPESFLSRMDQNGNGMLEPSEISDRMRGFLQRIAERDRSINLSQPIPISRLAAAMQRGRDDDDNDRDRDRRRGRGGEPDLTNPSLVPGFATEELPLAPGFGEIAGLLAAATNDDRKEADERLERYDRNRDGFLDKEEMARGRWSGQPFSYDRNGDGRLSRDELALRYADRRKEEERERAERDQSRSSGSSNSRSSSGSRSSSSSRSTSGLGSSSSSRSGGLDSRMEGIVNSVLGRYDKNRNGVLDRDEWGDMRTDPSGADKNRDGRITKEEMGVWFAERFQGGGGSGGDRDENDRGRGGFGGGPPGGGFGGSFRGGSRWGGRDDDDDRDRRGSSRYSSRGDDDDSDRGASTAADTRTYRFQSNLERISSTFGELPEWYSRSDVNADGQVRMSEYASEWPESKVKEFLALDANGDGVVTPQECLAAVDEGFQPGSVPASSSASEATGAASSTTPSTYTEPKPTASGEASGIDARYLGFAKGIVAKYDTNKDGHLGKDEASQVSASVIKPGTDADGDGNVTVEELAKGLMNR